MLTTWLIAAEAICFGIERHGMAGFGNEACLARDTVDVSLENISIGFDVFFPIIFRICGLLVAYCRRYGVPAWHCGRFVNTQ